MTRNASFLRPLFCGVAIGALGIAPGVSGGALAASFGYYEPLLFAAAHPLKALKQNGKTLCLLALGIAGGILAFGRALLRLFEAFPAEMRCAVVGIILATLIAGTSAPPSHRVRAWGVSAAAFAAGLLLFYGHLFPRMGAPATFYEFVLCGGIYALGTVVPGVSASCILLSMGAYEGVLAVVAGENWHALLPFAVGFAAVAAVLVCIVNFLYTRFFEAMSAAVTGFVAASVVPVLPPLSADKTGAVAVLCGLCGFAAALWAGGGAACKEKPLYSRNRGDLSNCG